MKPKILYLMHVDWGWIKQRPHFLAIELANEVDLTVAYSRAWRRGNMTYNPTGNLKVIPIRYIPFSSKKYIRALNDVWLKKYLRILIKREKPDIVWVTHPGFQVFLPDNGNYRLIYDCMDDIQGFDSISDKNKEELLALERQLLLTADYVFVSSANLLNVIQQRYPCRDKAQVVRNAYGGKVLEVDRRKDLGVIKKYTLRMAYVGTISSWFDFETLEYCASKLPYVSFDLIGPIQASVIRTPNKQINFLGPFDHADLATKVEPYDCMIMPFKLNPLVQSVDPVKLYEYINFDKPIISIYYSEIERFQDYITFYNDKDQFLTIIENAYTEGAFPKKYSQTERLSFLQKNSWAERTKDIVKILSHYKCCW